MSEVTSQGETSEQAAKFTYYIGSVKILNIYPLDKEHLLPQAAFLREVKVVCCLPTPFPLKTIQTRVGRAILTVIF